MAHATGRKLDAPRPETVFGFWVYIMTDCMIFASLFATFAVLRTQYAQGPTPKQLFDLHETLEETMCLLLSSVTCGYAMLGVHKQRVKAVLVWLGFTFVFGAGFLFLEISEFVRFVGENAGPDRSAFLSAFFTLVGTHGLHVTLGMVWMLVLGAQMMAKGLTTAVSRRLLAFSLFWHFLDIVWICLFTFVYLNGML